MRLWTITATASPDTGRLSVLHKACFASGWNAQALDELLLVKGTLAFVTTENAGFGLLRVLDDEAEVLTFAVDKSLQRQGVGTAIMHAMLGYAKAHGVKTVFLEVKEDNEAAKNLYHKLGFVVMLRRKKYYNMPDNTQKDALVMSKHLS